MPKQTNCKRVIDLTPLCEETQGMQCSENRGSLYRNTDDEFCDMLLRDIGVLLKVAQYYNKDINLQNMHEFVRTHDVDKSIHDQEVEYEHALLYDETDFDIDILEYDRTHDENGDDQYDM